jgi:putative addiction module antidote
MCYTGRTTANGEDVMKLEVKKIGNSTGLILPKELLSRLNFGQGDWLTVVEMADGSLQLRRSDPVFDKGMEIAEKAMKTYRNALTELAK